MSTRVIAVARLNATCRHELCEQLRFRVDPTSELSRLNFIIGTRQFTLPDLQQLIGTPSVSSVLSTLALPEFSRVHAHMEGGRRSALETTAADLQAELAETLMAATTVVRAATREITANILAQCGLELGYTVTARHVGTATRIQLYRGHETVLIAVHDDGSVEFNYGGLTDGTCRQHQLQLQRTAQRHGVCIVQLR
jgi:hypothetical protein